MEYEFIALKLVGYEAEWLRNLLANIPLWGKPSPSVAMHFDLQATNVVANKYAWNRKKRHNCLKHKEVKDLNSVKWSYIAGL